MKVNKRIFLLLALLGTLTLLNIQSASARRSKDHSRDDEKNGDNDGMRDLGDIPTEEYWDKVRGDKFELTGQVRTYYIAAEKRIWNYAPDGRNVNDGAPYTAAELQFVQSTPTRIGNRYFKCLYTEYTSSRFDIIKARPKEDEYMGLLGPVIRAEVGDMIKVVFLNRCDFPTSIHPNGVFYQKDNEGALYNDGTEGKFKLDDKVEPGESYTYEWPVKERCGPAFMDGSSVIWMYHGHTNEVSDYYAGLIGPMVITRKGQACEDGSPKDVHRELFVLFSVFNEGNSPYLRENFFEFSQALDNATFPPAGGFGVSNQKFSINGFIFGNGPIPTMKKEQRCRWYMMSMGGAADAHTPAWHGNSVCVSGERKDVVCTLPGEVVVADMCPDNVGFWEFHCHVLGHYNLGMSTRYEVQSNKDYSNLRKKY